MERYYPKVKEGLSSIQVQKRKLEGLHYIDKTNKTKTIPEIILKNMITPFNILNAFLDAYYK